MADFDKDTGLSGAKGANDSIDAQAEKMLRDIESTSTFVLRTNYSPEDLDPSDVDDAGAVAQGVVEEEGFEEEAAMEEVPVVQIVREVEQVVADQEAAVAAEEHARLHRHRLRNTLILVIIILLIIGAAIGVFVWRNSIAPNVKPSDTESLVTSNTGTSNIKFEAVDKKLIPKFAKLFGKGMKDVQEQTQGKLVLGPDTQAASDNRVPALKTQRTGTLINNNGIGFASVTLGLDKGGKLVYVHCSFDLDILGVADADFTSLASDSTVAGSLLEAVGVGKSSDAAEKLEASEDNPLTVTNDDGEESCEFSGSTGVDAPASWRLVERYNHSVGKTVGDNSLMRKAEVTLW